MEFSFSELRWLTVIDDKTVSNKGFFVGLHVPNNFEKILDIEECFLQSELSAHILNFSREFFKKKKHFYLQHQNTFGIFAKPGSQASTKNRSD